MSGTTTDTVLHARTVTRRFGGLVAVNEVDLEIPRGAIISLIGPNGAGKTTLFNVIAGILEPTSGEVDLVGKRMVAPAERAFLEPVLWVLPAVIVALVALGLYQVTQSEALIGIAILGTLGMLITTLLSAIIRPARYQRILIRLGIFRSARPSDMVHAGIGRTFQNIRLFQNMTAQENVLVGMHTKLRSTPVDAFLSTPRQRAEEARARVRASELLALVGLAGRENETARNLPYGDQRRLEVARALGSEPALLLLDEPTAGMNPRETIGDDRAHRPPPARPRACGPADRARHAGRDGHQRPDHRPRPRRADRRGHPGGGPGEPPGHRGLPRIPRGMSGNGTPARTDDIVLKLEDVNTYYGHIHALSGISMEVHRGEIVTLIGANGAGKTTTLKTISGLLHPKVGQVFFEGADISQTPAHELVRSGIGHAPEGRRIFSRLTVLENLQMGGYTRTAAEIKEELERVMTLFPRLRERVDQKGGTLSGGEQQMLAIGRAMMSRPRVLLLDEPSLGLAPILVQQIFAIIRQINQLGSTILLVEQNALQALAIAHRGYVLQTGRVVLSGTSDELSRNEMVRKAYLGED